MEAKKQERIGQGEKGGRDSGGEAGGPLKKPRADFFNPQFVDKDLDAKFHEALIEHITETCTSFRQYGERFRT